VVVVDADLRRRRCLSDSVCPLGRVFMKYWPGPLRSSGPCKKRPGPPAGLDAGEQRSAAGCRLASEAMRSVLRHLRGRFDLTFVDTLPWTAARSRGLGSYAIVFTS